MTTEQTSQKLICKNNSCGKPFIMIEQETKFYKMKNLPPPDFCPSCRHKQRMALRSERALYKRKCDKCHKDMLSTYPEKSPYKVYCHDCFWQNIG